MSIILKDFTKLNNEEITLVLNARNSEKVRKVSKNQQILSLGEHKDFIETLKNSKSKKYYLVYIDRLPIGVISFTGLDEKIFVGMYAIDNPLPISIYYLEYIYFTYVFDILKAKEFYIEILQSNKIYLKTYLKHKTIVNIKQLDKNTIQVYFNAERYFKLNYKEYLQNKIKTLYGEKANYEIIFI